MSDKRWNAMKRALARHSMHFPAEYHIDPGSPGRPGWIQVGGICPVSLMRAKKTCPAAVAWWFKDDDPIGDCEVCDAEDD